MTKSNTYKAGRHFLQVPGPTNIPDRILRAMDAPTIDHRGPKFAALSKSVLERIKLIFKSTDPVVIYPSAGTGAMEASLVNTLNEGDKIIMFEIILPLKTSRAKDNEKSLSGGKNFCLWSSIVKKLTE